MPNASERAAASRARKAAATTPGPEPKPAPQPEQAAAPAAPVKAAAPGKVDFSALAKAAKTAPELPKMGRAGGQDNPFIQQVRDTFEKKEAVVLPPIPKEALTPVKVAIRRAATLAELGVSIREQETEEGIVVSFQGKTRTKRNG